jgi:hypothetical protein
MMVAASRSTARSMTRADNSALIALTELQNLERERSDREFQQHLAERERRRRQQQQHEQLTLEAKRREVAEQARRVEAERQRAWEAAEDRRQIEEAEAKARAEQDARLADVQRELSAELDRRELRRTVRLAATGMGTALLASVAVVAVWMGTSRSAESPRVAAEVPAFDVDALSHKLTRLHEDNAALRGDLQEIRARAEAAAKTTMDDDPAGTEPTPAERPTVRPHRPHPRPVRRPTSPSASAQDEPPIKRRSNPLLVLDDDSDDPLAGIEKKPKSKPKSK